MLVWHWHYVCTFIQERKQNNFLYHVEWRKRKYWEHLSIKPTQHWLDKQIISEALFVWMFWQNSNPSNCYTPYEKAADNNGKWIFFIDFEDWKEEVTASTRDKKAKFTHKYLIWSMLRRHEIIMGNDRYRSGAVSGTFQSIESTML